MSTYVAFWVSSRKHGTKTFEAHTMMEAEVKFKKYKTYFLPHSAKLKLMVRK